MKFTIALLAGLLMATNGLAQQRRFVPHYQLPPQPMIAPNAGATGMYPGNVGSVQIMPPRTFQIPPGYSTGPVAGATAPFPPGVGGQFYYAPPPPPRIIFFR